MQVINDQSIDVTLNGSQPVFSAITVTELPPVSKKFSPELAQV